ncbi:hypothetical protein Cst_c08290 [Thermoclostridium stercorarium subsp. stercorarium DSM 8532]|uniref:Uncharacterized protein n=3 Tax=Thermoclostridium stercorarium TaxID=1510 RepID=L7VQI3_THES1|nr:hypothetical protein [Thermoclostridium stercorarium]AGC67828.1 hypothetical protein Cst_c08290 [Thermoclostridium stercorarium subsp. stercorarium DSM 8532]ANW98238.1 hypothetical protein CSTERTH_03910 [Thermoclostridium stercorarium subsp. thermolacticum DSM 2910]ANX00770.1 hypothetical protein CSTERLE_03825 [Thermoclostridium stercorarium subsp. leptospartum DSM 9219]
MARKVLSDVQKKAENDLTVILIVTFTVLGIYFESLTVFLIIFGMLLAKDFTKNAWGCIFVFVFLWNAF